MELYINSESPKSGTLQFEDQDEFDHHQEIVRAAYADMLHDHERNETFYIALKMAIEKMKKLGKPTNVLDIGTGTGLLSMMAAKCGADTITACEGFIPVARCAKDIITSNGYGDKIHIVPKYSTQMKVGENGDMKKKANILVSEMFDSDFIGEGALPVFKHAHNELLEDDRIVIPSFGRVYAQVVESKQVRRWNKLDPIDVDGKWIKMPKSFDACRGSMSVHDLQMSQLQTDDFKTLYGPEVVFSFDWSGKKPIEFDCCSELFGEALATGTANAVFMWWDLTMDTEDKVRLSCAPFWAHPDVIAGKKPNEIPWRDHWMQEIYHLPKDVSVVKGQTVSLLSYHDMYSFWFSFHQGKHCESMSVERPICTCHLHNVCSYTRIGMMNDPIRREKYISALKKKVRNDSVILTRGDTCLLGLIASILGAKMVYCCESSHTFPIIANIVTANNLTDKVKIISENEINTVIDKVSLVISEPFFTTAFLPWNNLMWKRDTSLSCPVLPIKTTLWALPVTFDHLYKIREKVHSVFGFNMDKFDQMVLDSSIRSESPIEIQPLWEYGTTALSHPCKIMDLDVSASLSDIVNTSEITLTKSGKFHAIVLWLQHELDDETEILTGPTSNVVPGEKVAWDKYTKQAVCFNKNEPIFAHEKSKATLTVLFNQMSCNIVLKSYLENSDGTKHYISECGTE